MLGQWNFLTIFRTSVENSVMKLEDIPDLGIKYPAKICVSLSLEAKHKLDILKKNMGKDTSELFRMLIDDFLETVDFKDAV